MRKRCVSVCPHHRGKCSPYRKIGVHTHLTPFLLVGGVLIRDCELREGVDDPKRLATNLGESRSGMVATSSEASLSQCTITFPKEITKNKRNHTLPISTMCVGILSYPGYGSIFGIKSGYIFNARGSDLVRHL